MSTPRLEDPREIVVDTSALVAVVLGWPDAGAFAEAMRRHRGCAVSAASVVEAAIVVEASQGPDAARDLDLLLDAVDALVIAVDLDQVGLAVEAWRRFGKGRHPAALNYGDCFSYALARSREAALLFKGDDFRQTDVRAVSLT